LNFFEHQQRARQRTLLLTLLFIIATFATLLLANFVVLVGVAVYTSGADISLSFSHWIRVHPKALIWTSLGTLGLIGAASMYRMASLSAGGAAVAKDVGGVLVDADASDPQKRQLLNAVEEMALAAGVPVPQVYVLEQEPGINAFAAGFTTSDAAVTVTRGALELLTRDELQGVVAHEFGHILNGDMRLNTRLLGMLYGIVFIGLAGRLIFRGLARVRVSGRGGGQLIAVAFLAGLALMIVGYLGTLFGTMIRAAVSRQREFLADASAVQFTRNPEGIAGALKKIAVSPLRAVLQTVDADEMSHMLLADGRKMFATFFATHPPILDRIKAIDKHFDPSELERIKLAPAGVSGMAAKPRVVSLPISPAMITAAIGNPTDADLDAAAQSQAAIPEALRRMAYSRAHAPSLVLALALNTDAGERVRQIARLRQRLPDTLLPHLDAVVTMTESLPPALRVPLVQMAFPALRQRSPEELRSLVTAIEEIERLDGRFDFLDYAFVWVLRVQLLEAASPQSVRSAFAPKLHALRDDAAILFSVLARAGDRDPQGAQRAYEAGMQRLLGGNTPAYTPLDPWVAPLDRTLTRLDALAPLAKQALIEALVVTILHDRRVSLGEIELLRAICASVHCPIPPLGSELRTARGSMKTDAPHAAA
jgi:Zn-dependent protease with chaperone function